jgi:Cof subfamily protein (haloacid dehalogenase superfamily)
MMPHKQARARPARISLVLSDVDGTLVTDDKVLTEPTRLAVQALRSAGIRFAITSSRPPAGLRSVIRSLGIDTPVAAFNAGMIVQPDAGGAVLAQQLLPQDAGDATLAFFAQQRVDPWVFTADRWLLSRPAGPYVDHERRTVSFEPTLVSDFQPYLRGVGKIVGVSDDFELLARCEAELRQSLGTSASVVRSQKYYLDVTHPRANKGTAVRALAEHFGIPQDEIVTIGDGLNDVAMFEQGGLSIAMGNAPLAVKEAADLVAPSTNEDDGFAEAVRRFLLNPTAS